MVIPLKEPGGKHSPAKGFREKSYRSKEEREEVGPGENVGTVPKRNQVSLE